MNNYLKSVPIFSILWPGLASLYMKEARYNEEEGGQADPD
jgi:hypothetical protein